MAAFSLPAGLPETVKAVLQPDIQTTDLVLTTIPLPKPTHPDDVLVRVHASAPCNGELLWAKNYPAMIPAGKLAVVGQDMAGTVVAAPAASGFTAGDEVFCRIDASRPGSASEYTLARASELARKPRTLGWVDAASVPLSALTAWQAVFEQGSLEAAGLRGDAAARQRNGAKRVLVTGASGSVGRWAVQLAALAGAGAVVALAGAAQGPGADAVRALGATEVVSYRETTLADWVAVDRAARECDLVVDMVGGSTLAGCWSVAKAGSGELISVNTPPDMVKPEALGSKTLGKSLFFIVSPRGSDLAQIAELIDAGKLKPAVDRAYAMEDFAAAFDRVESGKAQGKVIIKISDEA
ncbi:zinc-binding protein oxidoreductase [Sporothrix schenckii 1099-18]|uniref:Enoyl reductase (ER) domain-containing protein n=2 Tax=Sporothrix schenckii TaxID=29908 RepID=U7PR96_SPOS1|nr:zinc-binding protein oxidoreductase [Sporothrix schenckii 1099-18]ERS98117.1 hypothetical protein HMPREF1624_04897 [Sporothrix schenckii ATCC 58251]KJR89793.1 zinc-binding protein oxidoreductase [Sporothrix schenckii 1099-18]